MADSDYPKIKEGGGGGKPIELDWDYDETIYYKIEVSYL